MATLFAPAVPAVQPAFVYNDSSKTLEVQFSLSDFNTEGDYSGVLFSLTDPNHAFGWGSNSLIRGSGDDSEKPFNYMAIVKSEVKRKSYYLYFTINLASFASLVTNQYYQMQLYLYKEESQDGVPLQIENGSVYTTLSFPSGIVVSQPSQITLIRPINTPSVVFEYPVANGHLVDLNHFSGYIQDSPNATRVSPEYIDSLSYSLYKKDNNGETLVYTSPKIKNSLGTRFYVDTSNLVLEEANYVLKVEYTTINGYAGKAEVSFDNSLKIPGEEDGENYSLSLIVDRFDEEAGWIKLRFNAQEGKSNSSNEESYNVRLQRSDWDSNYGSWKTIFEDNFSSLPSELYYHKEIVDVLIESPKKYSYRFILTNKSTTNYFFVYDLAPGSENSDLRQTYHTDKSFLLDKDYQLSLDYNLNVSDLKYVVQENLTSTLGGRYPVVQRSGQTYYRQFKLSGTLFFDHIERSPSNVSEPPEDSAEEYRKNRYLWEKENLFACPLYFSDEKKDLYKNIYQKIYKRATEPQVYRGTAAEEKWLRKELLARAQEFLTNTNLKLFKSPIEGNMVVYLSQVSFTPNKTLGREVVDFSCTATEVCEPSWSNMRDYVFDGEKNISYNKVEDFIFLTEQEG